MTKNQIEYNKLLETRRSNKRNEDLTELRDTAAREAKVIELGETSRHNRATEGLQGRELDIRQGSLDETIRHNQSSEAIELNKAQEQGRHNRATESATLIDLQEKGRHNLVTEAETQRHNQTTEGETKRHNVVGEATDAARITLDTVTREQDLAERKRHNIVMEGKDNRSIINISNDDVSTPVIQPESQPVTQQPVTSSATLAPDFSDDVVPHQTSGDGHLYYSTMFGSGRKQLMYSGTDEYGSFVTPVYQNGSGQYYYLRAGKRQYVER